MNIHFRITDYCNMNCLNCWSLVINNSVHMTPDIVLKNILEFGPFSKQDKINICGGEPSLNPYCKEIINILLETSAKITFCTNAYNFKTDLIDTLLNVDRIQVPLEGAESMKFSKFRCGTQNYLDKILQFISLLKMMDYKGVVKFGTVLMSNNVSEFDNMLKIILNYGLEKVEWCVYPFISKDGTYTFIENRELLSIEEECISKNIFFKVFNPVDRNNKYTFINPNGTVSTIKDNVEIIIKKIGGEYVE
jgi:Predicted Fe-S oxidoreductases